jgi:signal transduction histidine kinase
MLAWSSLPPGTEVLMSRSARIPVVDDEVSARTALADLLGDAGVDVDMAADAFKAKTSRDTVAEQVLLDLGLEEGDRARLAHLHGKLAPQLGEIAQRFVDRFAARRDIAGLTSGKQIRRLRSTFIDWMASSLTGPYDEQFCDRPSSLGRWHAAAGLSPRHAITAINLVRSEYHDRIEQLYEPREGRLVAKSVDKVLDVEIASMLHEQVDTGGDAQARERSAQAERLVAMQTLSMGLAHEARNPLNSAILQLELLERRLRRAATAPKVIEPVEQVNHELARLRRLLDEFLAFAQPSALALDDHDVSSIVSDVVATQRPFATAHRAVVQIAGLGSLRARLDAQKLRLISQNLVRNAVEAVAAGGRVVVTVDADDEYVRLAVEDDGPGIPDAIQRRIYEPFFTTKDTGTGLGLSIVHGMVAAHGGNITFASTSQGTRFDVSLPRRPWLQRSSAT